ncbi:MAG: DUF975 family protein [Treponema sp.]|jgi:uncharacterized membrane protein|nr:DUF975 family protein [Treponema sp.]
MLENWELRAAARTLLKGNWLPAAGVTFLYCILTSIASAPFGIAFLVVGGPLTLGYYGYFINMTRGNRAEIENLFSGFKSFGSGFMLLLLQMVLIFLWTLLLIIPGIIKTLSYSMSFLILHDNPGMSALDTINASKKMMKGYKGKLFLLYLSFTGWGLLCFLTFGIGFLWLIPYVVLSFTNFYENLKNTQTVECNV